MYERYQPDWGKMHQEFQTGPCFICEIISRNPEYPAHFIFDDDIAIAFLDKYPVLYGYTLVCPKKHREHVTSDFTISEYLELQKRIYLIAEAVCQEVDAERVYLLAFGSQQGTSHVHWHVAPLPRSVPCHEQQLAVWGKDVLKIPESEKASLASRIKGKIETLKSGGSFV